MANGFLAPLNWLSTITEKLLQEDTFNDMQRNFLMNINKEAKAFQMLVLATSDTNDDQSTQVLSFEGRSHLNNIMGYAEELIDEVEGELTDEQRDLVFEVRSSARQLIEMLDKMG